MEISAHTILNTEFGPFDMAVFVDAKGREHNDVQRRRVLTRDPEPAP